MWNTSGNCKTSVGFMIVSYFYLEILTMRVEIIISIIFMFYLKLSKIVDGFGKNHQRIETNSQNMLTS